MKVCPRCSYVATEGRRVCLACRGSLMGTPAREIVEILEMREAALVGAGEPAGRAPWGPGLAALLDDGGDDVAPVEDDPTVPRARSAVAAPPAAPPQRPPAPVRTRATTAAGPFLTAAIDGTPAVPAPDPRPSAFESAFDVRPAPLTDATPEAGSYDGPGALVEGVTEHVHGEVFDIRPEAVRGTVPEPVPVVQDVPPMVDPPQAPTDEIAEQTRRRLVKLYDTRTAAAALLDVDAIAAAPRPVASPRDETARRPQRRSRSRVAAAVFLLVLAVVGGRSMKDALQTGDRGQLGDATTPIDKLRWRTVHLGPVRIITPGALVGAGGDSYQRYALPDLDLMVTVRAPAPSLTSDVALRTYTSQLAAQLGGRLVEGFALVSSEGTGFSARLEVDGRTSLIYVLSAPGAVVEVRGDLHDGDPARPQAIFERTINSIEVR